MNFHDPIGVTMDIGEISLTPGELLALRPGDNLTFKVTEKMGGLLRIDGAPWAYVDFKVEQGVLSLMVRELEVLPKEKEDGVDSTPSSY